MNTNNTRRTFTNQNGQCLIIDIADMNIEFINNLIKVLQDILTVGCSVQGGIRIPGFALTILTRINIIKYELDIIRGNFNKIQAALNSIVEFCKINEDISIQEYKDGIYSAINSVVRTLISKQNSDCDSINNIQHIGITLITVKNCQTVRSYVDSLILDLEGLSKIEKISIIELQNFGNQIIENNCGLTETIKMNGTDLPQLQKYFKRWLLDESNGTDLILHFPESQNSTLSIKCDIFECVINPSTLPFGHRVYLQTDNLNTQMFGVSAANTANPYVPVYELNILSRLSCNAICESTLFGLPLCLRPTKSWKLPLNEDKTNQEYFSEVCKQLADNDEFLFAQMRSHFQTDQFIPYFVLTPGESCLLIKSFASSDLILPWKQENIQSGTLENKSRICNALHNLKYENNLNPYNYESGLYSALRANLKHARRETNFNLLATSSDINININKRSKRTKQ